MSIVADPWSALADPTRRTVFARVAAGPCSVTEIARELPVSRPAVSQHHLRVLLDAQLVDVPLYLDRFFSVAERAHA